MKNCHAPPNEGLLCPCYSYVFFLLKFKFKEKRAFENADTESV